MSQPSMPVPAKRWNFRPRFSLRALFLSLTLVCLVMGLGLRQAIRQRNAVKRFYELTAKRGDEFNEHLTTMGYRYRGEDAYYKPIVPKWLHPLRDLLGEEAFGEVTGVQLQHTPTSNDDLHFLADIPSVERISLSYSQVTEEGLAALKACPHLKTLGLSGIELTDKGLVEIAKHSGLESLSLDDTAITDAGLIHLEKLTKLQSLWLRRTKVTDAGYKKLKAALPQCQIQADVPAYFQEQMWQEFPTD